MNMEKCNMTIILVGFGVRDIEKDSFIDRSGRLKRYGTAIIFLILKFYSLKFQVLIN